MQQNFPIQWVHKRVSCTSAIPPRLTLEDLYLLRSDSPRWRWNMARALKAGARTAGEMEYTRDDDELAIQCAEYLFEIDQAARRPGEARKLQQKFPALSHAHRLGTGTSKTRYFLEAMLCSGKPLEEVAKLVCLPHQVVWWFSRLFLDVEAYLDHGIWMFLNVFAPCRVDADVESSYLWKTLAWKHGMGADLVVGWVTTGMLPAEARHRLTQVTEQSMLLNAMTAAIQQQVNRFNENLILENYLHIQDNQQDAGSVAQQEKDTAIRACINSLAQSIRRAHLVTDGGAVEPRAHDTLNGLFANRMKEKETKLLSVQ